MVRFRVNEQGFLGRYIGLVRDEVIPYQEKALKDEIPGAEKSHCIRNFIQAGDVLENGSCDGEFYGMVFQDSDVAKWLEGAAYIMGKYPDEDLKRRCDEIIGIIGRAQHEDGYLNTFFTVKEPDRRYTCLWQAHELYCAGHMIEGAVAYAEETGDHKLLDIACRLADNIYEHFIVEGAPGYPGHPEIEYALIRLSDITGDGRYLELAAHFINVRGVDNRFFAKEFEKNKWCVWGGSADDMSYNQADAPVREQTKANGHAVRAVYLFTGMAALAARTGDESLFAACRTLWENITRCRMYITGGIGSAYEGEAFTKDYHLPNDTAYSETCASIGLIFFANQMLANEKNGEYADIMERALYNTVLAGMSLSGKSFFYVNPLECIPDITGEAVTHRHTLATRPKWFACACCPPNTARLLASIDRYAWSFSGNTVYSNLYIDGELALPDCSIKARTDYPFDGKIDYGFSTGKDGAKIVLAVRIPAYSPKYRLLLNGEEVPHNVEKGYAYIDRHFVSGDKVELVLDMSAKLVYANNKVTYDFGKAAVMAGPFVYCVEDIDNGGDALSLSLTAQSLEKVGKFLPEGICTKGISVKGMKATCGEGLYSYDAPAMSECTINMIPYYAWANRGSQAMRVWIPVK